MLERIFVVVAMIFFSGALIPWWQRFGMGGRVSEGDVLSFTLQTGIAAFTALLLIFHRGRAIGAVARDPFLTLLLLLSVFSFAWSAEPSLSFRRSLVVTFGTTAFGLYLAARFPWRRQLQLIAIAIGICGALSLAAVVLLPEMAVHNDAHSGAWRGVFVQKNTLGRLAALGVIVCTLLAVTRQSRRGLGWLGVAGCAGLLLATTSKTALAVAVTVCVLMLLFRGMQVRSLVVYSMMIVATLALGAVVTFLVAHLERLLALSGKDLTLTGRTDLWQGVVEAAMQRPWLGHGFNGFWLTREEIAAPLWRTLGWEPIHAHNGFLDLWLELGLVGLALFLLSFALAWKRALAHLRGEPHAGRIWPVAFLSFTLLYNLTESSILQQNNLFWMLYVSTALSLTVGARMSHRGSERPILRGAARSGLRHRRREHAG